MNLSESIIELYNDEPKCAQHIKLTYTSEKDFYFKRIKHGKGFIYQDINKTSVTDTFLVDWFKSLAIPPSWTSVAIVKNENYHLLSVGHDEAGRKQYKYHPKWREVRDKINSYRLIPFGESLPSIRRKVSSILKENVLSKQMVIASIVRLIDKTDIRVGNEYYADHNKSYGATTLLKKHLEIEKDTLHFEFRGKSGKEQEIILKDKLLAKILEEISDEPGKTLFSFDSENHVHTQITSNDINQFLQDISGHQISAKIFRTWGGSLEALDNALKQSRTNKEIVLNSLYETVSEKLGNTPGMARDHYIHVDLLDLVRQNKLTSFVENVETTQVSGLNTKEQILLSTLKKLAQTNLAFLAS